MTSAPPLRAPSARRLLVLAGVTALLRAPSVVRFLIEPDEGSYAAIACRLLDGGLPYRDGVENKFPAVFVTYEAIFRLFGRYSMRAVHVVVALVALATALACGRVARRLVEEEGQGTVDTVAGERAETWAALLYAVLSTVYYPKMLAGNTEMFLVLPATLAVWAALGARRHVGLFLVAGALAGVTMLYKQQAGALLAALGADVAWRRLVVARSPSRPRRFARAVLEVLLLALGFAAVMGATVWALARAGVLDDARFWTWTYVVRHYLPAGTRDHGALYHAATGLLPWLLCVSPTVALAIWCARRRGTAIAWWWLAAAMAGTFVGGRMYGHYFLIMLPAWCVLGGVGAATWLGEDAGLAPIRARLLGGLLGALGGAFLVAACLVESNTGHFLRAPHDYQAAARWVRDRTRASDRVFVWGWFPELYVEADRCPSTRFVYTHLLAGARPPAPGGEDGARRDKAHDVPEAWRMLDEDLARSPPAYILDTSPGDYTEFARYPLTAYPSLARLVAERYVDEGVVEGVRMYRRR